MTLVVDVVCPFSYLGCSRLFDALDLSQMAPSQLVWSFEPVITNARTERVHPAETQARYGDPSVLERRVGGLVTRAGVTPRPGVSSERAHVLLTHAPDPDLLRSLFNAHFEEGRDISSMGELRDIGASHGIAPELVLALLENPERAAEVRMRAARYADLQTPRIRISGSAALVGVQSVDTYRRALAHGRGA